MLRDDGGEEYQKLLRRFVDLPPSGETKVYLLMLSLHLWQQLIGILVRRKCTQGPTHLTRRLWSVPI